MKTESAPKTTRRKTPDIFSTLKSPLDNNSKQLLRRAARIARAYRVENNKVQPEFLFIAIITSTSGPCKTFAQYLQGFNESFKSDFGPSISDLYEVPYFEVSDRLQSPAVPRSFELSVDVKSILRNAIKKWGKPDPLPVDYILASLFTHKKELDILDSYLPMFDLNRKDLWEMLTETSPHFRFELPKKPAPQTTPEPEQKPDQKPEPEPEQQIANKFELIRYALTETEKYLHEHIVGQPEAVTKVVFAMKRAFLGLKNPSKPTGFFLFAGYTGVGKTELVKQLSTISGWPLLPLDMSEFAASHEVSKLIGSPPGYIGYGEGGKLTNFVTKNPRCIVLFDEIEKAHPAVFDPLLQIADEGRLTDGKGKLVSFKEVIVILTTNIGSREAAYQPIGFNPNSHGDTKIFSRAIDKYFRPEFLGRIGQDNIIIFNKLEQHHLLDIAKLELDKIALRPLIFGAPFKLRFAPTVAEQIVALTDTSLYGARNFEKTIEKSLVIPLTDFLLSIAPSENIVIAVTHDPKTGFTFRALKR